MTSNKDEPAFPVIAENGLGHVSDGMSLRDWYAGALAVVADSGLREAIATVVMGETPPKWIDAQHPPLPEHNQKNLETLKWWAQAEARYRLIHADAMLSESNKRPTPTDLQAELVEALEEARTDLMIAAGNARTAAKTDVRWEGVYDKLMARVAQADAVLAKAKAEGGGA